MPSLLRVSEATSLGLHAMMLMARQTDRPMTCSEIASSFDVSQAHLAKVLQRLAKLGLVRSVRGARGGFTLAQPAESTPLLQIYEAIEGPVMLTNCLFDRPACDQVHCVLGGLLESVGRQFMDYMTKTKLSDIAERAAVRQPVAGAGEAGTSESEQSE